MSIMNYISYSSMINVLKNAKLLAVAYETRYGMCRVVSEKAQEVGDSNVQTDDRPRVPSALAIR